MKKLFAFFWDRSLLFFVLIGAGNTVITLVGSQLLFSYLGYWGSTAIMFALTSIISFILNRKYSFQSNAPLVQSAVRFSIIITVCYLLSFGISKFLVPWFVQNYVQGLAKETVTRIAMIVAQVLFTAMNYLGQRLWAFKE